jgi:hypothetical protein
MKISNIISPNGVCKQLIIIRNTKKKHLYYFLFFQNHGTDKYAFTLGKKKKSIFFILII